MTLNTVSLAWPTVLFAQLDPDRVQDACGDNPSFICEQVLEHTSGTAWAEAADKVLATPLAILLIVVVAYVVNRLIRRAIKRLTNKIVDAESQDRFAKLKRRAPMAIVETGSVSLRSAARAQTLSIVLRSLASILVWTIAVTMVLGELGVSLGPLIAGAGIAGAALGFGAQSLVKDFLTGIFMLIEDQYGVGDIIEVNGVSGTVEAVTLRTTKLRSVEGTVWHVPNGTIDQVGNMSQQWARALLDVDVAYGTDVERAQEVIKRVADRMWRDVAWRWRIIEEPEVWGVEALGADAVSIRLVVKTRPGDQFPVMRELRKRLFDEFRAEDIEIPFPQRSVWVRRDPGSSHEVEGPDDDPTDDDPTDDEVAAGGA